VNILDVKNKINHYVETIKLPTRVSGFRLNLLLNNLIYLIDVATRDYYLYEAYLDQTGTNNPVPTIITNELGGDIVWSRFQTGAFIGTLIGAFKTGKTILPQTPLVVSNNMSSMSYIQLYLATEDVVGLNGYELVSQGAGNPLKAVPADGHMKRQYIQIRVKK